MFYYVLKYVLLGPLLRLVFRPRIEGLEHIPDDGRGHRRRQSPVLLRPLPDAGDPQAAHHLPGEGRVLHRPRPQGPADRGVLPQRRADPGGPVRQGGGPGRDPRGPRGAEQGRAARHLPGGHPLARRPALQGQGRRRGDGPQGAGAGDPLRDDRHLRGPAARAEVVPRIHPVVDPLRQAARLLPLRRAWRTRRRCCARSPTRSCTPSSALSEQEYVDQYAADVKAEEAAAKAEASEVPARQRRASSAARPNPGTGDGRRSVVV